MTLAQKQYIDTYKKTVKEEDRQSWPTWVLCISNSLAAKSWIGGAKYDNNVRLAYYNLLEWQEFRH